MSSNFRQTLKHNLNQQTLIEKLMLEKRFWKRME